MGSSILTALPPTNRGNVNIGLSGIPIWLYPLKVLLITSDWLLGIDRAVYSLYLFSITFTIGDTIAVTRLAVNWRLADKEARSAAPKVNITGCRTLHYRLCGQRNNPPLLHFQWYPGRAL